MKKMTTIWMMIVMLGMSIPAMGAMSISKMRQNARFLTDRMTYELGLTMAQYDDIYEVNYDFINNVRYLMDDVVRGYDYAIDRYYEYLDYRNDDLRWILSAPQYRRFMATEYFYRPIYTTKSNWMFRIFKVYTDVKHFYYAKPKHYKSYKGEHFRSHHNHVSFYMNHRKHVAKHEVYKGKTKIERKPHATKAPNYKHNDKKNHAKAPDYNKNKRTKQTPATKVEKKSKVNTPQRTEVKKETKRAEVKSPTKRTEVKTDTKRTNNKRTVSQGKTSTRSSESRKATNRGSR